VLVCQPALLCLDRGVDHLGVRRLTHAVTGIAAAHDRLKFRELVKVYMIDLAELFKGVHDYSLSRKWDTIKYVFVVNANPTNVNLHLRARLISYDSVIHRNRTARGQLHRVID